jgi:hypothetical protein
MNVTAFHPNSWTRRSPLPPAGSSRGEGDQSSRFQRLSSRRPARRGNAAERTTAAAETASGHREVQSGIGKQACKDSVAHARQPHPENRNAMRPNRDGRPSLLRCTGGVVKSAVADSAFSTLFALGLLIVGHKVKRQVSLALEDG